MKQKKFKSAVQYCEEKGLDYKEFIYRRENKVKEIARLKELQRILFRGLYFKPNKLFIKNSKDRNIFVLEVDEVDIKRGLIIDYFMKKQDKYYIYNRGWTYHITRDITNDESDFSNDISSLKEYLIEHKKDN